jgi:S-(hydroxymethyl)glutathione dehydrogenase / alcohol dehydrogenase
LACGGITGAGAVLNTAKVEPGALVVVIGAGGVGLNTVQAARLAGAARIIAIDIADEKLDAARAFGASDTLRADHPKLRRAVMDLTEGRGADYVFVTAGAISAYQGAAALAGRGGAVVAVGMPPSGAAMSVEPVILAATSQRMLGSNLGNAVIARDIPMLAGFYRQGRFKLDELVSERFPLERINEAIVGAKAGHALRNVLVMGA